jgi:hypothetical protein
VPGKGKRRGPSLADEQVCARAELRRIALEYPASLTIVAEHALDDDGMLRTTIRLPTGDLHPGNGGLPVGLTEDVIITISPSFPRNPPLASVVHERFVNCSHVLQGDRLCVFLDPDREWHPKLGIVGYLYALWKWFEDAIAGRFDAATALYHPVGGVLHKTPGSPTVVVRDDLPPGAPVRQAFIVHRTPRRLDLRWTRPRLPSDVATLIVAPAPLPFGAQLTLGGLIAALAQAGSNRGRILTAFAACARRNPHLDRQPFVLAVPNPATTEHFLLAGRLAPDTTQALRANADGGIVTIDPSRLNAQSPIEWCAMSDERPEITTRRDARRPVQSLRGKTVHVWGCGGLGSWIAEFVVRAGAAQVAVSDPAEVSGGLLVRQNYTENDVGENKAEALAQRLRPLSDATDVTVVLDAHEALKTITDVDLLIDATVNNSVGHILDDYVRTRGATRPTIAMVATDSGSATLGLLVVATENHGTGPATIDDATKAIVLDDLALARYHPFWLEPEPGAELIPARGCSTPTFHGSAADLAGVAGTIVNLLGQQMASPASGMYLFAQPCAEGNGPTMKFIAAPASD